MNLSNRSGSPGQEERFGQRFDPRVVRLGWPLFLAICITLLLFGVYEWAERRWLTGLEMGTLHLLHMVRGIFSSILVAGFVGWMIIKRSPGLLQTGTLEQEGQWVGRPTEMDRMRGYARWFIAMRWIAVLLAAILVFISVQVVEWLPPKVWGPLSLTVLALAGFNLFYDLLLRSGRSLVGVYQWQGYLDLVILTLLLHFSGGIENPLSAMMIFHVIIGGILLSKRQCYWLAAAASGLFCLLAWLEWSGLVAHYTLELFPHFEHEGELFHAAHHPVYVLSRAVLQAAVLFLTAYFVTTLAERLRQNERHLGAMAERALAGQKLLEQALETTSAGLRVLNLDLKTHWANNRWKEWFDSPQALLTPHFEKLNGQNSPAGQILQDKKPRVTEIVVENGRPAAGDRAAVKEPVVFQITTAPLLDHGGDIRQVVELAQDVTAQKQIQAQMVRAGKLAAVGQLAGQVAHEVNNPIAIVSAKVNLLLMDHRAEMSPKIALELGKVRDLANRVARIAQGLLSYCRPSGATRVRLDIRGPIRKSLAIIEEHAKRSGVRIEDQLPDRLPPVRVNANEMEQVFLNLFLNALDAMPKGGWLKVSVAPVPTQLRDGQPALTLYVEDTGDGVPEAIRDRVFEPFFTTKGEGEGTGLGLSICLGLVQSHGGELTLESQVWHGTRLAVTLPIDPNPTPETRRG